MTTLIEIALFIFLLFFSTVWLICAIWPKQQRVAKFNRKDIDDMHDQIEDLEEMLDEEEVKVAELCH